MGAGRSAQAEGSDAPQAVASPAGGVPVLDPEAVYIPVDLKRWVYSQARGGWVENIVVDLLRGHAKDVWQKVRDGARRLLEVGGSARATGGDRQGVGTPRKRGRDPQEENKVSAAKRSKEGTGAQAITQLIRLRRHLREPD